jgi:MFS family permease
VTAEVLRRRFLILRALRWFPTGLVIPVLVLLLLDRGLTVGQIGLVIAAQGVVVLALELPTGGLADLFGRRVVLVAAAAFDLASLGVLVVANTMPLLIAVFAMQGVYRALESGPLDAWYVDAAQAADPDVDIEGAMGAGGAALGAALAIGTVASSALVAWDPIPTGSALVTPLLAALAVRAIDLVSIWRLMTENLLPPTSRGGHGLATVICSSIRTVQASKVLVALVAAELLWGAGMIAYETFTPLRLEEVLGGADAAATALGPANAAAWMASAAAAAAAPTLARRIGPPRAGAILRIVQGLAVAGIALFAGPVGVLFAFVATMAVHGAANPIHEGLLHRAVTDPHHRATVLSINSLTGQLGGAIGAISLGFLAGSTTVTLAILVGASLLALGAPLYLLTGQPIAGDPPPTGGIPAATGPPSAA